MKISLKCQTWVKDTELLVEMRILQDGVLKPLFYKGLSLQSYRDHYSFRKKRTWQITACDLTQGLAALCRKDPPAKGPVATGTLTLLDVQSLI